MEMDKGPCREPWSWRAQVLHPGPVHSMSASEDGVGRSLWLRPELPRRPGQGLQTAGKLSGAFLGN